MTSPGLPQGFWVEFEWYICWFTGPGLWNFLEYRQLRTLRTLRFSWRIKSRILGSDCNRAWAWALFTVYRVNLEMAVSNGEMRSQGQGMRYGYRTDSTENNEGRRYFGGSQLQRYSWYFKLQGRVALSGLPRSRTPNTQVFAWIGRFPRLWPAAFSRPSAIGEYATFRLYRLYRLYKAYVWL
jgi:hypothetical protein